MATGTAFGPQTRNATTTLPSTVTSNRYGASDTWFKDCTDISNPDGTVISSDWFNMITGNLRYLVQQANTAGANITLCDGDMTLVYDAITYMANNPTSTAYAPSTRNITAGIGLTGGGTLAADVNIDFDINVLPTGTAVDQNTDLVAYYNVTDGANQKTTIATLTNGVTGTIAIGSII